MTRTTNSGTVADGEAAEFIARAWSEALEVDDVDRHTGFFDLGADSFVVVQVVDVLRDRWPDLRTVDVFRHSTVSALAEHLEPSG